MVPGLEECQSKCFNENSCVSYNLGPVTHQTLKCELNDLDHVTHPNDVITQEGAHYCPIKNPCSSNPCAGEQHCTPDFYNENYTCSAGTWGEWGAWSECTRSRTRYCQSNAGEQKSDCPGEATQNSSKSDDTEQLIKSCLEYLQNGYNTSGVYTLPDDIKVFCDQETAGGGWTVIQRRQDGSQDFYLGWQDYKVGFGNLTGEFWLGLDKMHKIMACDKRPYRLRIELEVTDYAEYDDFEVSDEADYFRMKIGNYSGNAGDSLRIHSGMQFSTKDKDNDVDERLKCAQYGHSGWWFRNCFRANLNGRYLNGFHNTSHAAGINWQTWKGYYYSAKKVEMKLRPMNDSS